MPQANRTLAVRRCRAPLLIWANAARRPPGHCGRSNIRRHPMTQNLKHFIEGAHAEASDGARMRLVSPVDEQEYGSAARGTAEDADRAVAAAHAQLEGGTWSRLHAGQRAQLLLRLADLVERDTALLADMDANA